MPVRILALLVSSIAISCASSGPAIRANTRQTGTTIRPTSAASVERAAAPAAPNDISADAGGDELKGIGFDPELANSMPWFGAARGSGPTGVSMTDAQIEDAVEGLLRAKGMSQKEIENGASNETDSKVPRVQTDGIFGYLGCSGMGVRECEAGLILDNGIGYRWHSVQRNDQTMVFDVPAELRHKLASIVNEADMLGRRSPAKPCPHDAGSQYLFLARHNVSSGRLAQCAKPGRQELTNAGFYTLENTFVQLLYSVESGEFSGRRIEFIIMTQGVRHYLGKLPAGDPRKIQVSSWLDSVTRAMS